MNWDELKEPLRGECVIITNSGRQVIPMHEPLDDETSHIPKMFPYPTKPIRQVEMPMERPNGKLELVIVDKPEDNPEILAKWEEDRQEIEELRWLAYVDAAIDEGYKPRQNFETKVFEPGFDDPEARVRFLRSMPKMVRAKFIATARQLSEKRLAERYEEAKKD